MVENKVGEAAKHVFLGCFVVVVLGIIIKLLMTEMVVVPLPEPPVDGIVVN